MTTDVKERAMTTKAKGKAMTKVKGKTKATGAKGEKATDLKEFLSSLATDPRKLGEFLHEPEAAMSAANLSEADKAALKSGVTGMIAARLAGVPLDEAFKWMQAPPQIQMLWMQAPHQMLWMHAAPQSPWMQAPPPWMQAPQMLWMHAAPQLPWMQTSPQYMQAPPPYMQVPPPYMQVPPPYMQAPPPWMQAPPQPPRQGPA